MPKLLDPLLIPAAATTVAYRSLLFKLRMALMHRRYEAYSWFSEAKPKTAERPRVLAVINHVALEADADAEADDIPESRRYRLGATIDGILMSFAHCELKVVVNTLKGRNLLRLLPEGVREHIEIVEHVDCNPLHVAFRVQDIFAARREDYDWFAFFEDDVVLTDSTCLDKLNHFNAASPDPKFLLFPNRFEMHNGKKAYIDLVESVGEAWHKTTQFDSGGIRFAEFANPHSGAHFLTRKQLDIWLASPNASYDKVTFIGPLESAATGSLMEVFTIYKPHSTNPYYFEVRHWDNKYSVWYEMHPGHFRNQY